MASIKEAVRGRELEVLQALGITPNKTRNEHITCPYSSHGGKDDWRWDAKASRAFCSCISGSHSIFDVVMEMQGCDFRDSLKWVAEALGIESEPKWPSAKAKSLLKPPANMIDPDLPENYLRHRLGDREPVMPSTMAVGWKLFPYFDDGPKHVGDFPCAVFETVSADGRRHAHRIYVGPDGAGKADLGSSKRDPKKSATKADPADNMSGCSVVWGDGATAPLVIVGEGIETCAAIAVAVEASISSGSVAVCAAIATAGIAGFIPWPANQTVIVAADRDHNRAGEKAARSFCARHHGSLALEIALPGEEGEKIDFLDFLLRDGADAVRARLDSGQTYEPDASDVVEHKREVVHIEPGRIDQRAAACERVLGAARTVYQRGAYLTRVARISDPTSSQDIKLAPGSLVMMHADKAFLQAELCRFAEFKKWSSKVEDWITVDPPLGDVAALMSMAGRWPTIPVITGITEVPILADDGRVIDTPGHDEATGVYFDPGRAKFPTVPDRPTRSDALAALKKISDLVSGFPFIDEIARSVALAEILTPFKRPFLRSAPMFLNTAPKMGSGKTLIASVVSYIATGNPPASMSQEENREEEKKRMLALLMTGSAVSVIDNIERPLKSDTLCTVLTEPVWKERILGKTEEIKVGTATTWIATGNNLEVAGDLSTRSLVCTIDPEVERPEERKFKVNLHEYIPAHRGDLAAACLTILKAYWLAKQRGEGVIDLTVFGRFEQWSAWIREPLVWLGMADPCQTRKLVEARDSIREELGTLLEAWYEMFCDQAQTINMAIQSVSEATSDQQIMLKDAMLAVSADLRGNINPRKLGKYIARSENRIESGFKFVRDGTSHKTVKWASIRSIGVSPILDKSNIGGFQDIETKGKVGYGEFRPVNRVRDNETLHNDKIVYNYPHSDRVDETPRNPETPHNHETSHNKNKALF